jgi:hypothetical protein
MDGERNEKIELFQVTAKCPVGSAGYITESFRDELQRSSNFSPRQAMSSLLAFHSEMPL